MEQQIKMAAKLYQCRDTAKNWCKEEYPEKIRHYIDHLKLVMKEYHLDEIQALLKISKTEFYQENGMVQMFFMAAVVEILEPSI